MWCIVIIQWMEIRCWYILMLWIIIFHLAVDSIAHSWDTYCNVELFVYFIQCRHKIFWHWLEYYSHTNRKRFESWTFFLRCQMIKVWLRFPNRKKKGNLQSMLRRSHEGERNMRKRIRRREREREIWEGDWGKEWVKGRNVSNFCCVKHSIFDGFSLRIWWNLPKICHQQIGELLLCICISKFVFNLQREKKIRLVTQNAPIMATFPPVNYLESLVLTKKWRKNKKGKNDGSSFWNENHANFIGFDWIFSISISKTFANFFFFSSSSTSPFYALPTYSLFLLPYIMTQWFALWHFLFEHSMLLLRIPEEFDMYVWQNEISDKQMRAPATLNDYVSY